MRDTQLQGEQGVTSTLSGPEGCRTEDDALHIYDMGWRADRREVRRVDGQVNGQVGSPFLQLRPGELDV